jgi:large subunit ribosomal protein L4
MDESGVSVAASAESAGIKVPLFSAAHERTGDFELSGKVFRLGADPSLLHEAVRMQLARRRSGTASTKTRGLISGGGRKPWRQKGTGRARSGSTRSPIWRHGGTIFGPLPRDYSYKMPKKAWRRALGLAIADRAANGNMIVVEGLELTEVKTKVALAALGALGLTHALIVVDKDDAGFARAARNLAAHKVLALAGLNVFDVLNYDQLLMTAKTARAIEARLQSNGPGARERNEAEQGQSAAESATRGQGQESAGSVPGSDSATGSPPPEGQITGEAKAEDGQ